MHHIFIQLLISIHKCTYMKINVQFKTHIPNKDTALISFLACFSTNIHLTVYPWEIFYDVKRVIVT